MTSKEHIHGPDCHHEHHEHGQALHVHGPHCNHAHHEPVRNPFKDIGRNDPCPCGSQKKFKKCHGA
ncbi:SEC-C metal-binding domain-containing protein [Denitrificimonas sp. JX-1]|uniref:SEC-C metal-binding domain-containing protein n=1 Tax=Denitrificimonas halotolerans TaxID=3098930 RepID=A0ABU5GQ18_9GAMM|nr:SEC-C metal-binding domain-containing protein [Denitrificimonas sp. JX-1]MDY7219056.1 SEC-C metal-binding domain-containing protein [Denitrificimonas sp. JX-1]